MKKRLHLGIALPIILVFLLSSCEEETFPKNFPEGFHRISSIEHFANDKSKGMEIFDYGSDSLLMKVDDLRSYAKYKEFSYDDQKRLREILTYQAADNVLLEKDSIAYNQNQKIEKIYFFHINTSSKLGLSSVDEYYYYSNGFLQEKVNKHGTDLEYESKQRFYWKNNNIIQVNDFDDKGNLLHEWFYEYDNKVNYQLNNPNFITSTWTWTQNNITSSFAKDYTGLLDLACNPCKTQYIYNSLGLPILVTFEWGRAQAIAY